MSRNGLSLFCCPKMPKSHYWNQARRLGIIKIIFLGPTHHNGVMGYRKFGLKTPSFEDGFKLQWKSGAKRLGMK